jgi:hypothetical protein
MTKSLKFKRYLTGPILGLQAWSHIIYPKLLAPRSFIDGFSDLEGMMPGNTKNFRINNVTMCGTPYYRCV